MAVETTTAFSGPYNANGATTTFGFTFIAKAADEIGVLLRDGDGVDSVVSTSAYTVTLNANGTGSVVFTTAPASGNSVYIYSDVSFQQSIDFEDGTGWKAAPVNEVSDRAALRDIYLKNRSDRSLVVPYGETGFTLPTAAERQGLYLAFDADGDVVTSTGTGADSGLRTDLAADNGSALSGFLQSGTGATARTAQAKMRDVVSVKDFGAVGDGVTDDSAAIQSALNAHAIVSGDGDTYAIGTSLTVGTEKCLRDISLVALTAGMDMVLVSNKSRLEDVTLEGTGTVSTVERGVYPAVDGASDVVIKNIKASNLTFGVHAQPLTSAIPERWSISGHIHDIVGTIGVSEGYGVLLSPAKQCSVNVQFDNIRRHALYLSAGASQNRAEIHVDGCGGYAAQIYSTPVQPACEGNVIRGTFRNLAEDVANQVGAVSIISKAHYNDISISVEGGGAKKAVWIEGTGDAVGPYPTGNSVHDCSFYGSFTDTVVTSLYAASTQIHNNKFIGSFTTCAINLTGNATTTFTYGGDVQGNVIDGGGTSPRGIINSCECDYYVGGNRITGVTTAKVADFSTAKKRIGFNLSCSGSETITNITSLNTKDATITLPFVIENPRVQAIVNTASVSTLNAPITCIAGVPSGSPMTFLLRAYNGGGSAQDVTITWTVKGD